MQLLYCFCTDFCYGEYLATSQCSNSTELCTYSTGFKMVIIMSKFPDIGSTKKYTFKEFNECILSLQASEHAKTKNMPKCSVIEMI